MRNQSFEEIRRVPARLGLMALSLLLIGSAALAGDQDPDDRLIGDYVLTVEKLTHYIAASTALSRDAETDGTLKAEIDRMADEPDDTIAEMQATLTAHPRIGAYYSREGLSVADAIILPLAAANAAASADASPPPDGELYVSAQQKAFARDHIKELRELMPATASGQD